MFACPGSIRPKDLKNPAWLYAVRQRLEQVRDEGVKLEKASFFGDQTVQLLITFEKKAGPPEPDKT